MQVKYHPSHITGRTFSLRDTEVIICIILVLLKTAKYLNHYLYVLFRQTQPAIFINISIISWRSVLLVEETGVP
jgi:hypothetical protein